MLRSIFTSIASALRSIWRVIFRIGIAPLRFIDRVLVGGDYSSPQEIPEVRPHDGAEPTDNFDRQAHYLTVANRIVTWAADSIAAGRPLPLPSNNIPIGLREWAPGLTRDECCVLIKADEEAVSAHLQGLFALPGVRRVSRLSPLTVWPAGTLPAFDRGSAGFVSCAVGDWPARLRARARAERS